MAAARPAMVGVSKRRRSGSSAWKVAANPGDDLRGEQGVPPELEEVVVDADPLPAEERGPDLRQSPPPAACEARRRRLGAPSAQGRRRQRPPVDLASWHERERVHPDVRRGHHVVGQGPLEEPAQVVRRGVATLPGHPVGHEPQSSRPVLREPRRPSCDGGMLAEDGLDLSELDAEAADLDLIVGASQELDVPVGSVAGDVAGLVEPRARPVAERISDEPLPRQARLAEVAARHAGAADVQLSGHADRHRREVRVQEVDLGVARLAVRS